MTEQDQLSVDECDKGCNPLSNLNNKDEVPTKRKSINLPTSTLSRGVNYDIEKLYKLLKPFPIDTVASIIRDTYPFVTNDKMV